MADSIVYHISHVNMSTMEVVFPVPRIVVVGQSSTPANLRAAHSSYKPTAKDSSHSLVELPTATPRLLFWYADRHSAL